MRHGKYIGPRAEFRFCGALVRPDPRSRRHWLVQFDCMRRPDGVKIRPDQSDVLAEVWACVGWHRFKRSDFKTPPPPSHSHTRKRLREWCERGVHWWNFYIDVCVRCKSTRERVREEEPRKVGKRPELAAPFAHYAGQEGCNCIICLPEPHSNPAWHVQP